MTTPGLILKEVLHRKLNFLLGLAGIVAATGLFVFLFTAGEASRLETTRLMQIMGLNLRVLPRGTDMDRFWAAGYSDETMPEEYVAKLASHAGLDYAHLLPTLKRRIEWRGTEIFLVGVAPEVSPVDRRQPSMSFAVEKGSIYAGHEIVRRSQLVQGSSVEVLGKTFTVARCLPESGTDQDITIFAQLRDAQALLGMEGKLNEIQALNCVCFDAKVDSLDMLREQLASVLPEAKVIQIRPVAQAREKQRQMVEDSLAVVAPFLLVVCAGWIGLLAMINVRERRTEIGVLRALGYGSGKIAALFLGKAVLGGILGALVGFGAGTAAALLCGPGVFKVTGSLMAPLYGLLGLSLVAAPVFAALCALIPAAIAATQDPAVTLREE